MADPRERLIVALDVSSAAAALKLVVAVGESVTSFKVGMQLYTAEGPEMVRDLVASGKRVFLDLKYHDIPNTVAAAVREAAELGVSMLTVHAAGGSKMLRAAVEAAALKPSLKVLAVSVLTSMREEDLREIGATEPLADRVVALSRLALGAGCQGVVASAREAQALRGALGNDFTLVTPGIRPAGAGVDDQARVVTPAQAITAGASHIVIGRPITGAANPAKAAGEILKEIEGTLSSQLSVACS